MSRKVRSPQAEKRFSDELLESIFTQAADGIFVSDKQDRYVDVNPRGCEMLGYTRQEILKLFIRDLFPPEDLSKSPLKLNDLQAGKTIVIEHRLRRKDGTLLPIEVSAKMLSNGNLLGIVRDISKSKRPARLLTALNRSAEAMAGALTPDEVFSATSSQLKEAGLYCVVLPLDKSGNCYIPRYLSIAPGVLHRLESLTGIKHEDFSIPINALDVFLKVRLENRAVFVENTESLVQQVLPKPLKGLAAQIVKALRAPKFIAAPMISDDTFYGIFSAESDDLAEGDLPSITAFAHQMAMSLRKAELFEQAQNEIAERKQIEETIVRNERRFRALIENGLDNISLLAADGSLLWESPATIRALAYEPDEFVGRNIFELMHPDDLEAIQKRYAELIQEPGSRQGSSFRMRHSDGTWRWIEAIVTNLLNEPSVQAIVVNYRDVTERVQAQEEVKKSEERYRHLFINNPHPMMVYDLKTLAFLAVNDAAIAKYGYTREEFLGMTITNIRPQEDLLRIMEHLTQPRTPLKHSEGWRHRLKDGTIIDVEVSSHTLDFDERKAALVIAQDVTERKKTEARVRYVTRLYATLSQVNQTIVRVKQRDELFETICKVAVEFGQFRMAWIGLLDEETGNVNPGAHAGHEDGYLRSIKVNIRHELYGKCLTGVAIRTGKIAFVDDIATDVRMEPWREQALEREYHSFASVPIRLKSIVIGVLNLYATETGFFSNEELSLLEEIGMDISFALDMIETEAQRKRAEEEIKLFRRLIDQSNDAVEILDPENGRFLDVNEKACLDLDYSREEFLSLSVFDIDPTFDQSAFRSGIDVLRKTGSMTREGYHKRRDGSTFPVEVNLKYVQLDQNYIVSIARDVSERKQAETALLEGEQRYRRTLSNMMEGCQIIDHDWRYIYINDAAAQHGHYKPDELLMHTMKEMYPGIEETELFRILQVCMEERRLHRMENKFIFPDGATGWFELSIQPVPEGLFILSIDITDRKKAEDDLRSSEDRYRDLVENSRELICTHDLEGKILSANSWAIKMMDAEREADLIGKNIADFIVPKYRAEFKNYLDIIQREGMAQGIMMIQKANGERRIWEYNNTLRTEGVSTPIVRGMAIDVTERRQAEAQLKASEEKYRSLFNNVPDGVYRTTVDGSLLAANPALVHMLGYDFVEELQKVNIRDLYVDPNERLEFVNLLGKEMEIHNLEVRLKRKDGRQIIGLDNSRAVLDESGTISYFEGTLTDITKRKQAVEALQESEARFRSLFESAPVAVWEEDFSQAKAYLTEMTRMAKPEDIEAYLRDHPEVVSKCAGLVKIIDVNQAVLNLHGADNKAQLLDHLEKVFVPESYATFLQELIAISKGSHAVGVDSVLRTLSGLRLDVNVSWAVVPGQEETLSRMLVSVVDITERKRAEEEIGSRTDELTMLYALSRSLADADSLDMVFDLVSRHAVEGMHTTFARIALVEGNELVIRAAHPIRILDQDLFVDDRKHLPALSLCQGALEQHDAVVLRSGDPDIGSEDRAFLLLDFAKSVCLVPLWVWDSALHSRQILGLLMLGEARDEEREPFTPRKIGLARNIGDQAASAINRMLLREQTERRLQRLAAMGEIDRSITSSFDLHFSLGVLLNHIMAHLGVDAADVLLFNQDTQMLEFLAGRGFRTKVIEDTKLRLGQGLAGHVALKRHMVHITNLQDTPDGLSLDKNLAGKDFVSYYGIPLIAKRKVRGVLEVFLRAPLEPDEEWLYFLTALAEQAAIAIDNLTMFNDLQRSNSELVLAYETTLEGWSRALDLRDKETEGHTQRVTEMTVRLARAYGMTESQLVNVRRGGLLHDIGKMGVPDNILLKPRALTEEEWKQMRLHPVYAYDLLSHIAYLRDALEIPYCHHEKWDGTGYPRALKGEEIPLAARIFAVVDVWDALTSDRPYRKAWTKKKALEYIRSQSGSHFDPKAVELFLKEMLKE